MDDKRYPNGATFGQRYRIIGDGTVPGIWSGVDDHCDRKPVWITCSTSRFRLSDAQLELQKTSVPGAPKLLFSGPPDDFSPPEPWQNSTWWFANVQRPIDGTRLIDAGRLSPDEVVRLGTSLCQMLIAWDASSPVHSGMRPETVFVGGTNGERYFAGAMPHMAILYGIGWGIFPRPSYNSPGDYYDGLHTPIEHSVVTVALILWYAALNEFAFDVGPNDEVDWELWEQRQRPFTGPPELGRLLRAVLIGDTDKRMKVDELLAELHKLAAAWNVDIPPFPPAGLD